MLFLLLYQAVILIGFKLKTLFAVDTGSCQHQLRSFSNNLAALRLLCAYIAQGLDRDVGRQNFETFTRLFPLEGFTFVSPLPWFPD
jgi:hypothetical protein